MRHERRGDVMVFFIGGEIDHHNAAVLRLETDEAILGAKIQFLL